jgi:hypothetical protein
MNRKPTGAVLSSIERTAKLVAAQVAQQPTSTQAIREDWGKDSHKANAKFQWDPSEISAHSRLQLDFVKKRCSLRLKSQPASLAGH